MNEEKEEQKIQIYISILGLASLPFIAIMNLFLRNIETYGQYKVFAITYSSTYVAVGVLSILMLYNASILKLKFNNKNKIIMAALIEGIVALVVMILNVPNLINMIKVIVSSNWVEYYAKANYFENAVLFGYLFDFIIYMFMGVAFYISRKILLQRES